MVEWKDWKRKKSILTKRKSMDQFQSILLGNKSELRPEEFNEMIEKFSILPMELLQKEVELQVKLWRHDCDGRRDFSHVLHKEINKWEGQSNQLWNDLNQETRSQILSEIKQQILFDKFESLISSEKSSLQLTKALFAEYSTYCKEKHYKNCVPWGVWLQKHMIDTQDKLDKVLELKRIHRNQELEAHTKQSLVTTVDELEVKLNELQKSVKSPANELLLRHLSFEIRKDAKATNHHSASHASSLITSLDFEKYLNKYNLDTSDNSIYRASTDAAFTESTDEAHRRQLQINQEHKNNDAKEFQAWLSRKSIEKEETH
jgi:hypothetical protein